MTRRVLLVLVALALLTIAALIALTLHGIGDME